MTNNDDKSRTRFLDSSSCNNSTSTSTSTSTSASEDGSRPGYHTPDASDKYLPNCRNPLRREYWRVFQSQDGSAYMIPRPDGLGDKYQICSSDQRLSTSTGAPLNDESIADKARKYGLCGNINISELNENSNGNVHSHSIGDINSMEPDDALEFSTIFHRQLEFVQDGEFIDPYVPDEDILAACEALGANGAATATATATATTTYCDQVKNKCNLESGACIEMEIIPTQAVLDELIPALNELYGVRDAGESCNEQEGATFGCPMASCVEPPKGCTYSTTAYAVNTFGDCCPRMCFAVDADGKECTLGSATNSNGGATRSSASASTSTSILSSWSFVMTLVLALHLGLLQLRSKKQ